MGGQGTEQELRSAAISRIRKRRDFHTHATIYVAVNTMLVVIWAATAADFFWPILPMLGWGIGLSAHAWDTYGRGPISEDEIQREEKRLRA